MAIIPVTPDDIEFFTTIINPSRSYSSSSVAGVTGSISVFARSSKVEKEVRPAPNYASSVANDEDVESYRLAILSNARKAQAGDTTATGSFFSNLGDYMDEVNQQSRSVRKQQKIDVRRFTPSVSFTSNTVRKLNVKDVLMPYYRMAYHSSQWAYTNYNSLNFFADSASQVPSGSALLYPSVEVPSVPMPTDRVAGSYALSGAFSFDFCVNPRYKRDGLGGSDFRAGTIFHLSSSYALSLVTGSLRDENGLPAAFRLKLQLSHSADIQPSVATPGVYPNDLVFLSDDNSLRWNDWHRVVVRWGTNLLNDGTGSFNVNGVDRGHFVIPSGTIMPKLFTPPQGDPSVLVVGNYYEGNNRTTSEQGYFFSDIVASRDGVPQLVDSAGTRDQPLSYLLQHPLNAEVHNLLIRREYLSDKLIAQTSASNDSSFSPLKYALVVPPFFVENTNIRRYTGGTGVSSYGGVLQTPFFEIDGSTDDPFNVALSFGVNGHYVNLENFTKDFANGVFPRLHHLSGTAIPYTTTAREANEFLYDDPFVRKRNLTLLPCDDGNFHPNYGVLEGENPNKGVDAYGRKDLSAINLDNLLYSASFLFGTQHDPERDPTFLHEQVGYTPENPGMPPGSAVLAAKKRIENTIATDEEAYSPGVQRDVPLTIYQRTKDQSSNQVTFFDISNLFYGSRILPGSLELRDASLSGSNGRVSITLKDDGEGNLYRADSRGGHSDWNSVGNVFYNEGVAVVKSPHLYFFGKEGYELSFRGEQQLHTSKYEIVAPRGMLNSSSNATYVATEGQLSASMNPGDTERFVYISNVNFHDENLNVVAKAVLAQPVLKREGERIMWKIAFDF